MMGTFSVAQLDRGTSLHSIKTILILVCIRNLQSLS